MIELISDPLTLAQKLVVVPVPEMKRHARISGPHDDRQIAEDIETAYDFLSGPEGWLGRMCLLEEEFYAYSSGPRANGTFELPLRPLAGGVLVGLDYLGSGGTYSAIDSTGFYVSGASGFGVVSRLPYTSPWPYVSLPHQQAYRFRFRAGFGTTRESIPSPIRKAIKMLVAEWYNNRETIGETGRTVGQEVLYGLRALAGRYRIGPDHS